MDFLTSTFKTVKPTGELWRAFLAEFLAMTMFVFLGCGSVSATGEFLVDDVNYKVKVNVARILPIATCFGLAITVLAFNIGPISGGHINPAVTFSLMLMKKISVGRAIVYMVAQFSGAVFGALLLWGGISSSVWTPNPAAPPIPGFQPGVDVVPSVGRPPFMLGANQLNPVLTSWNGLLLEIMGTSFLIGTVLTTAVDNRSLGQSVSLAPLPIGISIWVVHLVLIPWTGCGINPARTFGPALVNSFANHNTWETWWWIYYFGPALGSILTCMVVSIFWGGRQPPGTASAKKQRYVEASGKVENADGGLTHEVDLDAITI